MAVAATKTPRKRPARKTATAAVTPDTDTISDAPATRPARKATSKRPPAKKTPAKRATRPAAAPATDDVPSAPARKRAARKTAPAAATAAPARTGRKTAAAKTADPTPVRVNRSGNYAEKNDFGLVPDTDSTRVMDALMEGGKDRMEINERVKEAIARSTGLETRGGVAKNVPSLVSGMVSRLLRDGWTVESHYRMVPPKNLQAAVDARLEEIKKERASAKRKASLAARKAAKASK